MFHFYARCSTKEQNEDRQLIAFSEFIEKEGISEKTVYIDKESGKNFNRTSYSRMIKDLKPGDVIVVKSIDRLGRNYNEILEQWRIITKELNCYIVVIDMQLLDTRNSNDLTGTLIADIVLQLLSYVAETERQFIRQRQAEGIEAAKARGVKFGKKPMKRPDAFPQILKQFQAGDISSRVAGSRLGVSHATFLRWAREEETILV